MAQLELLVCPSCSQVLTRGDYDEKRGRPLNPEIGRLQQAYPLNLLNGQYPVMIGQDKKQPSMLVKVP